MISLDQAREIMGGTAMSSDGDRLGKIGQIYLDDRTGEPEWATVNTGLFASRESFVPLALAQFNGTELEVPYGKDTVKAAPDIDAEGGHLSREQEAALYTHYGLDYSEPDDTSGSGPDTAVIRSEEREEIRIEREPITALAGDPSTGPALGQEEHEIVLYAQRAVLDNQTVPVERVRLDTHVVRAREVLTAQIRKEQIDTDGVDQADPRDDLSRADTVERSGARTDAQRLGSS